MPFIVEKTFNSEIFTKVGNPTITDDGVASGFSSSSYIKGSYSMPVGTPNFDIYGSFETSSSFSANTSPFAFGESRYNGILFQTTSTEMKIYNSDGSSWGTEWVKTAINTSTKYYYRIAQNATNCTFYMGTSPNNLALINTTTRLATFLSGDSNYIVIGTRGTNTSQYWQSSIDLNSFKIIVDGKVVLNGTTSKEVYVLPSIQEIKDYYSNTLIVQYNGKPKAKATIEMLVDLIYDNVIFNQIQEAFDWKTAVGKQLDIIGKWVGVSRVYQQSGISGKTYLSYPGWDDETDTLQHGYSDYTTFNSNTGNDLTYKELNTLEANLNDDDYRTVIGLKIIKNNINHTAKNIDDAIWKYFNGKVYTTWSDYKITYHYPAELTTIIEVCNAKNVLLAPIGVNINLLQME